MKHFRKIICFTTIFSMLMALNVNAAESAELKDDITLTKKFISTELKLKKAKVEKKDGYTITTITDKDELKNPDVMAGAEIPEGYKLVEVKIGVMNSEDEDLTSKQDPPSSTDNPQAITQAVILPPIYSYYAKNAVENPVECYFPNNPDYSDWYDGPASISISEQRGFLAKYTATVGLTVSDIEAAVGFEVGINYNRTVTYSITASSTEKVNVKVFSNNKETKYEEWKQCISRIPYTSEFVGTRYAYKPIGSIWKQYRYTK
ncbi:MAG: hypothetical protein N3I35_16200 [Clostridia bacterium]|nr:hypothetical protein [Clostridia bacterium]